MAGLPLMKIGEKHGRLTVLSLVKDRKNPKAVCVCECGKTVTVQRGSLRNGHTSSCGCVHKEILASRKTHGQSHSRVYRVWRGILDRCNNPSNSAFHNYGGRGISVEWDTFDAFIADMGMPQNGLWIDRINNDGNYCKHNCRWSTPSENAKNKRASKYWVINGIKYLSSVDAAKSLGVHQSAIVRGCNGYKKNNIQHKPIDGWYSYHKYAPDNAIENHSEVFK